MRQSDSNRSHTPRPRPGLSGWDDGETSCAVITFGDGTANSLVSEPLSRLHLILIDLSFFAQRHRFLISGRRGR